MERPAVIQLHIFISIFARGVFSVSTPFFRLHTFFQMATLFFRWHAVFALWHANSTPFFLHGTPMALYLIEGTHGTHGTPFSKLVWRGNTHINRNSGNAYSSFHRCGILNYLYFQFKQYRKFFCFLDVLPAA